MEINSHVLPTVDHLGTVRDGRGTLITALTAEVGRQTSPGVQDGVVDISDGQGTITL
jgi:hypothetical protein